jgi:3-hydroxyisobutyrate dehydrogenase-like beta-hydroxyacid dehydrogenase
MSNNISKKVSVIGLGQMGKKIAEMFTQKDYDVTVWNRTAEKAKQMPAWKIAANVEDALTQSTVSVICIYDNAAVTEILARVNSQKIFAGKTIINFTSGGPEEVKKLESWLSGRGAKYLNGAIQVAPDQMGLPDTTILIGGNREAFVSCKDLLYVLGGNIKFLGEHASSSPAMDMATLSWVYGSFLGLMYGVAFCEKEGINLKDYSTIIGEIAPSFLEFYKYEIKAIHEGNFNITQSPLSISITASQRITDTARSMGLDSEFTDVIANLLHKAKDKGYENEEVAALIKVISDRLPIT